MIDKFTGEYRWLSNFYPAEILYDGLTYPTSEHAYQAAKTLDVKKRQYIANLPSPGKAKRAGQLVVLRADWEQVKIAVMREIVRAKFSQHPDLRFKLVQTGDEELVEGNTWGDRFWGVCNGSGQNQLGKILMEVRR